MALIHVGPSAPNSYNYCQSIADAFLSGLDLW